MNRQDFLDVLRNRYPWPPAPPPLDVHVHGWATHEDKMRKLCPDAESVLEVGTWVGKGTLAMLRVWPKATIVCVDTWLGSIEHQIGQPHYHPDLAILYGRFLRNLWLWRDRVIPIRQTARRAFAELTGLACPLGHAPFDLVYIDSSHLYRDVLLDVNDAGTMQHVQVNEHGIVCGDDYQTRNGVQKAVDEYAALRGMQVRRDGRFWWYERS